MAVCKQFFYPNGCLAGLPDTLFPIVLGVNSYLKHPLLINNCSFFIVQQAYWRAKPQHVVLPA